MGKKILALLLVVIITGALLTGCARITTTTVTYGTLKVTVFGLSHIPLQGAKVVSEEEPDGQLKVTGLTDADGIVWFQNIKAGNYDFYISRFDYNQTQFSVIVNPGQTIEIPVYLELTNPASPTPTTSLAN
jgi:hypothetical protein